MPNLTLNTAEQITPLKDIPLLNDRLQYDTLTIQFLVDENLENYREIHGWLTGVGFPKNYTQFQVIYKVQVQIDFLQLKMYTSKELGEIRKAVQRRWLYIQMLLY